MGRLSKREKKARLRDTVLAYARSGVRIKEICGRTGLHRNTIRLWIKEGGVEKKAPAKAEKPLSDYELLREVDRRLPAEVKAKETAFKQFLERLEKRRNWDLPFPPEFYGE